ncbi:lactate utilization protein [Desulfomicrobium sp. ZS1]|jgi:L-lactate dehydrogenase complex protein LldG|uniref:LutC/YkgG family protein n=1 Tax=Desulfomicrobium sp. ZS1 TaxID=2952228 RepID=UPI0020B3D78F|nr:lactate utilization protein [Desulfomicrobium sp. ZS1]UTF48663.1 lactate utilization protein [Desulfomicrobium sp. ZS1]
MGPTPEVLEKFRKKAEIVSAIVSEVDSMAQAIAYTVDLCDQKEACQLLMSGCEESLSDKGQDLCELKEWGKIIAAPALNDEDMAELVKQAASREISVIKDGMRSHLAGVDIGFTLVDYGIAETGSLVIDSSSEELRLATMISEIHVAVIPKSRIRATGEDMYDEIKAFQSRKPNYLAFVTGASRTADIERVLALGVHGPLELHILILEDK